LLRIKLGNSALQEYQSSTAIIIRLAANESCEADAFCHTSISPYVANKQQATTRSSCQAQSTIAQKDAEFCAFVVFAILHRFFLHPCTTTTG
jgi:hypothetical protein